MQPMSREGEQDQLIDIGLAINEVEWNRRPRLFVRTLTKGFGWDNHGFTNFD
jgi:hypothetical protein